MEIQPAWGIQRPSREQIDAIGNKDLGQGTITWGRDSKKFGGEQLVFQVGPSTHHSIHDSPAFADKAFVFVDHLVL